MKTESLKILIVDDEADILEFVGYNLRKEGYEIITATNGDEAIQKVAQHHPALVLLDVMMPGMDGIEVCSELRKNKTFDDVLIAMLTARNEDYSQIAGLDSGADDYISKPIRPRVLVSRIKSLLRRAGRLTEEPTAEAGVVLDLEKFVLRTETGEVALPRREFELLKLLMSRPGKVFQRESILSLVWGTDVVVGDRTIDVHIRRIREKIGDERIQTVKGVGYKYVTKQ